MHRDTEVAGEDPERPALPPLAAGISLGLWIALMLFLAFVLVPTVFGSCQAVSPA